MRCFNYSIDKPLPDTLELGGKKYKLTLYFDRVIKFYDLMRDKESEWSDIDKIDIAYSWLVSSPKNATISEKFAVVAAINDDWLSDHRKSGSQKKTRTAVNFIADSSYIYAAFRQYYGVNLFEQQGKLLWWEFLAMFDGLPGDSQIKEIMYIRTRDMPTFNGHNSDEIFRIQEQREFYFLDENWEEIREESENALSSLFDKLTAEAVK